MFNGKRMRRIRKLRKLTLADVSALAGVSKGHLSGLENGKELNPSSKILFKVASALQVEPSVLFEL